MSGHSHYATIKRQKGLKDAQKGQVFSKLAREIAIAVKAGGGPDPESNYKLRVAVDRAHAANMPKDNVERAISKGSGEGVSYEEVVYEGFAPGGISVMVEAATDNKNRTSQEIKGVFERGGGNMAGPGSTAFNFDQKAQFVIQKSVDPQEQMLRLIDLGVEDVNDEGDEIEVYSAPGSFSEVKKKLEDGGFNVTAADLVRKPKSLVSISERSIAQKVLSLLSSLEDHDDVQQVFANLNIPQEILSQL